MPNEFYILIIAWAFISAFLYEVIKKEIPRYAALSSCGISFFVVMSFKFLSGI